MAKLRNFKWSRKHYVVWTEGRRSRRVSTGSTDYQVARRFLAEFEARLACPPEQFDVNDVLTGYTDDRREKVANVAQLESCHRNLSPHFGAIPPSMISTATVRGFTTARRRAGRSDGTIRRDLETLRAALAWARKAKWLRPDQVPYIEMPPKPMPRERWLSREETDELIAAATTPHIRLFVIVAVHTGARRRAILDLTWDRVDLDRGLIVYPLPGRDHGKKRRAIVPMNGTVREALTEARKGALTDWVIEFNGKPVGDIKKGFATAVKAAGIAHCSPHDLRRTCATWMVQEGVPLSQVARFLGDTERMIEKVYGRHSPDYLRDAAAALEGSARNVARNRAQEA